MLDETTIRHSLYSNLVLYETYAFFDLYFGVNGRVRAYYTRNVTSEIKNQTSNNSSS